jgi:hypothetical protein
MVTEKHLNSQNRRMLIYVSVVSYRSVPQMSQKRRSHLKILGARTMTRGSFQTYDPQTLGATSHSLRDMAPTIFSPLYYRIP